MTPLCVRKLSVPDMKDYITRLSDGESFASLPAPGAFTVVHATTYIKRVKGSRKVIADFNREMDAVLEKAKKDVALSGPKFEQQFADYLPGRGRSAGCGRRWRGAWRR